MQEEYSVFRIPVSEEETIRAEVGMPRLGMPMPESARPAMSEMIVEDLAIDRGETEESVVPEGSLAVYKELNAIAEEIERCRNRVWMR